MASEIQNIIFNAADPNASYGLRLTGRTELFKFTTATTNSEFKTGIDTLLAAVSGLSGVTSTVTGAVLSGSSTKSGTKQVAYSGDVDVPSLQVFQGAKRQLLVNAGDGSNYSADGGTPFLLGISQAAFQANQRAIDAAHAAAVSIGNSTAPTTGASHVTVSGAGYWLDVQGNPYYGGTGCNGQYESTNLINGESNVGIVYHFPGTIFYLYHGYQGKWVISCGSDNGVNFSRNLELYKQIEESQTIDGSPFTTAQNNGYSATVVGPVVASSAPGAADFTTYFQVDATPNAPSVSGTGAVNTSLIAAGSIATTITVETTQQGTAPTPQIASVTPTHAKPGEAVILTGQHMSGVQSVSFSGRPARQFQINSDTEILAVVPPK